MRDGSAGQIVVLDLRTGAGDTVGDRSSHCVGRAPHRGCSDDDLGPFFDDIDMSRIVDHQTKFISSLMGGPASYTDDQIQKMHDHLDISSEHFDVLSAIIAETLTEFGLEPEDTAIVTAEFEKRRSLVTGEPNVN